MTQSRSNPITSQPSGRSVHFTHEQLLERLDAEAEEEFLLDPSTMLRLAA